jgi:hypothetical protein
MAKYAQGIFTPKFPEKYIGKKAPKYRSSWELALMTFFDNNKNILKWSSESIAIQYRHPFTGKMTNYIPDFFVVYVNTALKQHAEVIEVKPRSQTIMSEAKSKGDQQQVVINMAKWQAAKAYCAQHGFFFRIITEHDIFSNGRPKR